MSQIHKASARSARACRFTDRSWQIKQCYHVHHTRGSPRRTRLILDGDFDQVLGTRDQTVKIQVLFWCICFTNKSKFNVKAPVLGKKNPQLIENAVCAINFKPGTISHSPICISNKTRVGLLSDSSSTLLLLWSETWLLSVSLNRLPVPRWCEYRFGVNINEVSEVFWIFSAITTPYSHF